MNEQPRTHKDLDAWKRSVDLVEVVYKVTKEFPREELYGLTSQLRRATVSIPSNIVYPVKYAERELFHGAKRLDYLDDVGEIEQQIEAVRRLILGLIRYLRREDTNEQ